MTRHYPLQKHCTYLLLELTLPDPTVTVINTHSHYTTLHLTMTLHITLGIDSTLLLLPLSPILLGLHYNLQRHCTHLYVKFTVPILTPLRPILPAPHHTLQ